MEMTALSPLLEEDNSYGRIEAKWEDKSNCCCNVAHFTDRNTVFIGHWKKSLTKPVLITLLMIFILLNQLYDIFLSIPNFWDFVFVVSLNIFIVLSIFISYWIIIARGPGYVPYNWDLTQRKKFDWSQEMSSIVMYREQEEYGRRSNRPPRSSFAISAGGRFVLRADHYCLWVDSWIGFKNHRYFILFTFWSFLYCILWFVFRYRWFLQLFRPFVWTQIIGLVLIPGVAYLLYFSFHHFYKSMINLSKNVTVTEMYNKRNTDDYNHGCFKNYSEICGSQYCVFLWPFPCFCLEQPIDGFYMD